MDPTTSALPSRLRLREEEEARRRQEELKAQIDRLRNLLEKSEKSIALEEDHFRSAISCAPCSSWAASRSKPVPDSEDWDRPLSRFEFPALDQRQGADPTWADTMDTLRAPKKRDQKPWEWRRESPIRPVVFEDTGTMEEDVVHLHLEHRVVQRLLGRFTAQGFIHHDLSRACVAQTRDAIPRVVLIGRLCLYGPGAARLHEELVPVTARWAEPSQRKQPLSPYARESEIKTLDLLESSLLPSNLPELEAVIQEKLRLAAPVDVEQLLDTPGEPCPGTGEDGPRCPGEAGRPGGQSHGARSWSCRRSAYPRRRKSSAPNQMEFDFGDFNADEMRQLESNKRHWEKRLAAIDRELKTEPERIKAVYEVKAQRIEPVGLIYLWPVTG